MGFREIIVLLYLFKLFDCEDVSIINVIKSKLVFTLPPCSICLVARVGGKLIMPVYLDPHPPEYQSKIILLILLISNYLNVKMYQL